MAVEEEEEEGDEELGMGAETRNRKPGLLLVFSRPR